MINSLSEDISINNDNNNNIPKLELSEIYERKKLVNDISNLSKLEHIEIFKLLNKDNVKYTENSNGIFINVKNISIQKIKELQDMVKFYLKNKENLKKSEKILNINKHIMNIKNNEDYDKSDKSDNSDDNEHVISKNKEVLDNDDHKVDGRKIILKQDKPTYTGIKAKIIKNYKGTNKNKK